MAGLITLVALTAFIVKNAPSWLISLRGTILDKGRVAALDKGKEVVVSRGERFVHGIFRLDEREQLRHLEQALKNATERGLATFDTLQERDLYKDILRTLSQPGPQGEALRREVMQLFALSETADLAALTDLYNQRQRFYNAAHQDIDAAAYLSSFFTALIGELYADAYFRSQLSDVLQRHVTNSMQQSLLDIVNVLNRIGETLEENYSVQDFARDVAVYATYIERTLHHLKIGVVPEDQNADPELSGIFVPLRIALKEQIPGADQQPDTLVTALEQSSCLVLLGGPGSGKSTATKHLAWSHAATQSTSALAHMPLLSGNPLPLRIELRRLSEERKHANYDFLSFVTEVLLKRDGIEMNAQMFRELLTRRCMLLLFDGLDEVATLEERLGLVGEIEHFALCYPGNRVLVTSRPVGYDLARISHPLFSHAEIQHFNDEQMQQFLENWYTAVLRLSPIPQREREELNVLLTTLKENPRLHKLAENPLLLTVITALHRYERLPDRRVLVYDRCADLLLETWARLKGTDKRWKDMKMVKEDQYACIAHLGFVLHERSQKGEEKDKGTTQEDIASDVPTRFILREIEQFLENQNLFSGVAERRLEAKRFIELIQVEAGLIVERGTDEGGESLYGFVHNTFQEYFAAADVYERYQQEDKPAIISQFLTEYLHDPHWHEVILLLFGKLKRKPATVQLRLLLSGNSKSNRSKYTDVLQQDLFFACSCLAEDIAVANELAEFIISRMGNLVKNSPFPTQRVKALQNLSPVIQTRQYDEIARRALRTLLFQNLVHDINTRIQIAQLLYQNSPLESEERQQAAQMLFNLAQQPDPLFKQSVQAAQFLYQNSPVGSEEWQQAARALLNLAQRPNLSFEQIVQVAHFLYQNSPVESKERRQASLVLLDLVQQPNLSLEQALKTAEFLYQIYQRSLDESEERQHATQILLNLAQQSNISLEQALSAGKIFYEHKSPAEPEERRSSAQLLLTVAQRPDLSFEELVEEVISFHKKAYIGILTWKMLLALIKRPDLPIEQLVKVAQYLYQAPIDSEEHQQASLVLFNLVQQLDLSFERLMQVAQFLYQNSPVESEERQQATRVLFNLVQRPDIPFEQTVQIARFLYQNSPVESEERQHVTQILLDLAQRPNTSFEETFLVLHTLYKSDFHESVRQQVIQLLLSLTQRSKFSAEQPILAAQIFNRTTLHQLAENWQAIQFLLNVALQSDLSLEQTAQMALLRYQISPPKSEERQQVTQILLNLSKRPDLSADQVVQMAQTLYMYQDTPNEPEEWQRAAQILLNLTQRLNLSFEQTLEFAQTLYQMSPDESEEQEQAIQIFLNLAQQPDLSSEQVIQIALILYQSSPSRSRERQSASQILLNLAKRPHLPFEQALQVAQQLYLLSPNKSEERQQAFQMLLALVQQSDLSCEQVMQVVQNLYWKSPVGSEERQQVTLIAWELMQSQTIPVNNRLEIATVFLTSKNANYLDRLNGVQMVNHLLQGEPAKQHLKEHWQPIGIKANISDISSIVELVRQEVLPTEIRDEMYKILLDMVPQLENLGDAYEARS